MKRHICLAIAGIILVSALALVFYGFGTGDDFEKTLLSSSWYVKMSEGTTAVYTFQKNGTFDCEAHITLGQEQASLTRSGTYEVDEDESGAILVLLLYPNADAPVEITCTEAEDGTIRMEIAGCEMLRNGS